MPKQRQSNIELLRIIAMMMIVGIHFTAAVGWPHPREPICGGDLAVNLLREYSMSFFYYSVDAFVLISGWFGIRFTWQGLGKFVFQCLFIWLSIYFVLVACGMISLDNKYILQAFFLRRGGWFVKSYLFLFILSPILNVFVEHAGKRQHLTVLIVFYLFQSLMAWYPGNSVAEISRGYSALSFIGLYLLARYVRLYVADTPWFKRQSKWTFLAIALILAACISLPGSYWIRHGVNWWPVMNSYVSPLTILGALCLLLFFSRLNVQHKVINFLAAGSFTVYLFHENPIIKGHFIRIARDLFHQTGGMTCLLAGIAFVVCVYLCGVAADQIRVAVWKGFLALIRKKTAH